jgi:enoyl-CoA hydratase/carnithine racemase
MNLNFSTLQLETQENFILVVKLNRPEVRNAINSVMMRELWELWSYLYSERKFRCVILTGNGDKAFCAGADLKERRDLDLSTWMQQHSYLQKAMLAMMDCPIPIIAAVNGVAFGGGLELTLAADFAYASTQAIFAQSETKLGIMPGAMGTQNLPKACGMRRAKELCLTASSFTAQEALQWEIVNHISEPEALFADVLAVAKKIIQNAPVAVRQAKRSMNMSSELDGKNGYFYEVEAYNYLLTTKDRKEGINAFNEKRNPVFSGE